MASDDFSSSNYYINILDVRKGEKKKANTVLQGHLLLSVHIIYMYFQ